MAGVVRFRRPEDCVYFRLDAATATETANEFDVFMNRLDYVASHLNATGCALEFRRRERVSQDFSLCYVTKKHFALTEHRLLFLKKLISKQVRDRILLEYAGVTVGRFVQLAIDGKQLNRATEQFNYCEASTASSCSYSALGERVAVPRVQDGDYQTPASSSGAYYQDGGRKTAASPRHYQGG